MIEEQYNGWRLNNGSYFKISFCGNFEAILVYRPERDSWSVQISTVDEGLFLVGYISAAHFEPAVAQRIAEKALAQDQTYGWWSENAPQWWAEHVNRRR